MKSVRVQRFGEPEVMGIREIDEPRPGPGQVRIRLETAGVNPVDTYIRSGTYHFRPELPYTPGMDGAGRVDATGEGVESFGVGDRVYCAGSLTGTYAEKTVCEESRVFPLAEALSFSQGASVGTAYGTAYHGLFHRARALPGETVLVHGATGGVGTAAVQLAAVHGMTVFASGGSDAGRRQAAEQGADHVLDHHRPGHLERLTALTGKRGVDVILEMLANVNLGDDLKVLAPGGRVVVIGSRGTVQINPRDAMKRNASILGMLLGSVTAGTLRRIHAALGAGFSRGVLSPVVGREFPLAEAPAAHRRVMKQGAAGQIVLHCAADSAEKIDDILQEPHRS